MKLIVAILSICIFSFSPLTVQAKTLKKKGIECKVSRTAVTKCTSKVMKRKKLLQKIAATSCIAAFGKKKIKKKYINKSKFSDCSGRKCKSLRAKCKLKR